MGYAGLCPFCLRIYSRYAFNAYQRDRKLQLAVERLVEIIGETARRVSEKFRRSHPEIPWRSKIAQRNVLVHEYGEIKHERIWLLVTTPACPGP